MKGEELLASLDNRQLFRKGSAPRSQPRTSKGISGFGYKL
jgi:hypothetical protein